MQRFFLTLQYDGSSYSGWQIQDNASSIQAKIQEKLWQLNSNKSVEIIGCGRTDAGVHASYFAAHFEWDQNLKPGNIKYRLNLMLPNDIAILGCYPVQKDAHSRFDAVARTYHYYIHFEKDAFINQYSMQYNHKINLEAMNNSAAKLIGKHDFHSFCKSNADVNNYFCTVHHAVWKKTEKGYYFEISANRFLRNMVRAIVGTMLEIGWYNHNTEHIQKIIEAQDRQKAGESVPAKGLFLTDVKYPSNLFLE